MGINPNQINIMDNTGLSATEGSVIVSRNSGEHVWSSNSNKSIIIPVGNTAQRDGVTGTGRLRINTDLSAPELSINDSWKTFGQLNAAGDQTNPGISFASDSHTGFYSPQANQISLSVGGGTKSTWTPILFSVYSPAVITGTVTNAGVIFSSYVGNTVGLTVTRAGPSATLLYDETTQAWTSNVKIKTNVAPTQSDDVANKAYVDAAVSSGGIATTTTYGSVKLATLTQAKNGTSGVVSTADIALAASNYWLDQRFGVNNSLVWGSSNQGPGTGMNADLLDGQHGSYYASVSSLGSYVAKTGDTMTGPLVLSGNPTTNLHAVPKQYADTKLALSGGTMTGALTLAADPTTGLHAATKQYVDTAVGAAGMSASAILNAIKTVDGSGSGLDADLLDGQDSTYYTNIPARLGYTPVNKAGDTMTGALTLSGNPGSNLQAAPKQYVDTKLALTGGTMTGALTLASDPSSSLQAATKQYVDGLTSASAILNAIKTVDGSGSGLDADTIDGLDSSQLVTTSNFGANSIVANGYQYLPSGLLFQWGRVYTPSNANSSGAFPIAFPNACFAVSMNGVGETGTFGGQGGDPTVYAFNNTTYYWHSGDDNGCTAYWIAVGY